MGAASSSKVDQEQIFLDKMVQKCGTTKCTNYAGPVNVHVSGDGTIKDIKISQKCEVDSECVYKAMSESISKVKAEAAADAAAGLGIAVSDADIISSQDIQKHQEQTCEVTAADNTYEAINLGATDQGLLENVDISQIGNAKQKCMFEGLSKSYQESINDVESKATSLFGGTMGNLILGFVLLLAGGIGLFFIMRKQQAATTIISSAPQLAQFKRKKTKPIIRRTLTRSYYRKKY